MMKFPLSAISLSVALVLLLFPGALLAEDICFDCHEDEGDPIPELALNSMAGSVHGELDCTDCHSDIDDPEDHAEDLATVDCAECHEEESEQYQVHGRARVGESNLIPDCSSCHGTHGILSSSNRKSSTHPFRLAETCGTCHEDDELTENAGIRFKHPVSVYTSSVHGRHFAATCVDCHSTGNDSHKILPPGDSRSTINHFNIPSTCGKCHEYISEDYWAGIHGRMTADGEVTSPTCTSCHGEHNILLTLDPRSPVSKHRLAEATCSPCHESAALNEKYELPTGRLQSFQDSYHGLKSQSGDVTVANCASCHGSHLIRKSSNPESSIHVDNLQETCGSCHEGITREIAQMKIHESSTGRHEGWAMIVQTIYQVLIAVVIGGMLLYVIMDFRHHFKQVREKKRIQRMDGDEVVQHTILAISFTVLVISGFSLRFHDAWWSTMLFGWEGGYSFRGVLHRFSGVVLLMVSVWHLLFCMTARGRIFLKDMWPRKRDFTEFKQMMLFNMGRSEVHPKFARFSYVEKVEYWALIWGTAVMGITGILLWFDNSTISWMPKGTMNVLLVFHYYEAWLAFLAILVWHLYATIFNPRVYPMNPSWIDGYMPEDVYDIEHPDAYVASTSAKLILEREWKQAKKEGREPKTPEELGLR